MARRKSAVKQRADKKARLYGAITVAVLAAFGLIGWAWYSTVSNARALDEVTLCPRDPDSTTVLLVDVTDPLTVAQKQDLRNRLDSIRSSIPRYGKLTIVRVGSTTSELLKPIITRCNPGQAKDVSETTGNPKKLQRRWDEGFKAPLDAAFDKIAEAEPSDQSPIMESIQSVALTELKRDAESPRPHTLILVSDLLQHTPQIDFYKGLPEPAAFVASPAFSTVRTDLSGVTVQLLMLQRGDTLTTQPRALVDVWEAALTAQGAVVDRVSRVSG